MPGLFATLALLLVVSGAPGLAAKVAADGDQLDVRTVTTYTLAPEAGVVRVVVDIRATNLAESTTPGGVITRYFCRELHLALQPEATRVPGDLERRGAGDRPHPAEGLPEYGYQASFRVVQGLVTLAGDGAMRDLFRAASRREISYVGAPSPETLPGTPGWRWLLDGLQARARAATAESLFRTWVVAASDLSRLDARKVARGGPGGVRGREAGRRPVELGPGGQPYGTLAGESSPETPGPDGEVDRS